MSFKVGDKVRVQNFKDPLDGQILTINRKAHKDRFYVTFEGYYARDYHVSELIKYEPTKTQTVSHLPEGFVVLKPDEKWVPGMAQPQPIPNQETIDKPAKKCTCGIAAIGGGMHSDWCDLYQEQTNG